MKVNFRNFSIGISWLWLGLFVLIPSLLLVLTSILSKGDVQLVRLTFTLSNYFDVFNWMYIKIFLRSLLLAGFTMLCCLVLGFPFAYIMARAPKKIKDWYLLLTIIPFWTSSLITTYAIIIIIKARGLLNSILLDLGVIHQPLHILYTNFAVVIGLVYNLLPFMILPIYANLDKLDVRLIEAARDLGASVPTIFRRVIFPLAVPGVFAGSLFVLLPAMTMFFIPELLGGARSMLLGNIIQDQFITARNWPLGASLSILLTLFMALLIWFYWKSSSSNQRSELL
ncbi:MAG: ABC transporter permease subunit [Gammaproteobacteria bacterium]|nr:ABC transporter permease subunit [Gammaproteobacteria bacterium]